MTANPAAPLSAAEALQRAIARYEAGELAEAAPYLRAILQAVPDQFESLHLLGVISARQGDHEAAATLLGKAVAANPGSAEAHLNLGHVLALLKRTDAAARSYGRVVELAPDHVDAQYRLGLAFEELARPGEALTRFATVAQLQPDHVDAHYRSGLALMALGRFDAAAAALRRAIALTPDVAAAHGNLGVALHRLKRLDEAAACFRRALEIAPDDAQAHNNFGAMLHDLGRSDEAAVSFQRAVAIDPGYADAHLNLGLALGRQRRFDAAVASLRRAVALKPDSADAQHALGVALTNLGRLDAAVAILRKTIALKPDLAEAHHSLATALREFGRLDAALASANRAVELRPDLPGALSQALLLSQRTCDWTPLAAAADASIAAAGRIVMSPFPLLSVTDDPAVLHRAAAHYCAERVPAAPLPLARSARPARDRIRLAYLSADFHEHAVAWLAAALYERHDRARFELHAVSLGPDDDGPMRRRLRQAFDSFTDARRMSDLEIANDIRRREIDILVDLNGHTRDNRLGIAALRPAPVQVSYLGYAGTTGAPFIDYVLVDRFVVPPDRQAVFSEKLVHLPDCYQVNDRGRAIAEPTPSRKACGLPETGFVFCAFGNAPKITPVIFEIWMRLLRAVPGSVLWLLDDNRWATENLKHAARIRGVEADRLVFAPRLPVAEHLARHRCADLFLDTLPYNAHTTASDALWAGLPLLTCAGRSFASRVAGSLLHAIGLPELVTGSLADYEALALQLARDSSRLRDIRARLAANRLQAPLFDTDRFRHHIEAAYTQMWSTCQRGAPPTPFAVEPL